MLGVSSVVLRAAGCSYPKPPADLISLWALDETSPAGGVFDDLGPADLPMAMVGSWTDLATASMVQTVGGTSAYTNGSGYATIAADDPAHGLPALTVSFYYQRQSATAKQILLAAGDGTQQGDFSIEVLADGRLRGYHVGQDGALRFFEDDDGIAGTNLQVGTAHRIDLSLGPQGARIYLDGAELDAAGIFANRNSWNNARIKYLGRWIDGISAPADGVFDRVRIWNQQLTNGEIALLEPAQSIEIGGAPPAGDELSVPSLAQWLPSDETDPPPTKYVSYQNWGSASGSSPADAQEAQSALNGASPGDTFLAVCQRPGTIEHWDYPSGLTFPSGTPGNLITLQARKGDGVVISAGEDFAGARTKNSGFWTQSGLSQADIDKHIWRSTGTFSGGAQNMMGFWIEFDHPHQIVRASNMTNLRAAYGSGDSPAGYCGPCVHKDTDNCVYIRFQRPHPDKYSAGGKWSRNVWPNNPEAVNSSGQFVYPVSEDPNDYSIYLTTKVNHSDGQSAFRSASSAGGFYKIGSGINSMGYRLTFSSGNHDVVMRRGTHWAWMAAITGDGSNPAFNYDLQRARFTDGSKLHLARAEWKFGGWLESIRSVWCGSSNQNAINEIYAKDCTIADFHEMCTLNRLCEGFRFRNCSLFHIYDDGIQSRHDMSRVEIGYCYAQGCCPWGGMGESGDDGNDPAPGNWFIHHNIVDMREERNSDWRTHPHPHYPSLPHSPDGDSPRKIYNNLLFFGPDQEEEAGPGFAHCGAEPAQNNTTAFCHEIFNNIVIRQSWAGPGNSSERYDPTSIIAPGSFGYSRIFRDQTDYVMERVSYDADQSNELWDYNLYYKDVESPVDGLLRKYRAGQTDGPDESYATLATWKASASFDISKAAGNERGAYSDGFEGNSTDSAPTMASLTDFPSSRFTGYRPSATSAVTVATSTSLSGEDWYSSGNLPTWGDDYFDWDEGERTLAPSGWKGPLDPDGSTLPVGVQNP